MKKYIFCFFLISACESSNPSSGVEAFGVSQSITLKTKGAETLKLEDGSELKLPDGIFSSPTDVIFSRFCGGIFEQESFNSCQYKVEFKNDPQQRFEVKISGEGILNGESKGEYKAVGVLHNQSALTSRVFALRSGKDARCLDNQFSACGGDLVGEWVLVNACGPRSEILPIYSSVTRDPYAVCGEGEWLREYPFTTNKTLTFNTNGQYGERGGFEVKERRLLTQNCLDVVGESCHETCDFSSGICVCLYDEANGDSGRGGAWAYSSTSPTTLVLDGPNSVEGEESGPGELSDYCVDGETLSIRQQGRSAVFVYQKR